MRADSGKQKLWAKKGVVASFCKGVKSVFAADLSTSTRQNTARPYGSGKRRGSAPNTMEIDDKQHSERGCGLHTAVGLRSNRPHVQLTKSGIANCAQDMSERRSRVLQKRWSTSNLWHEDGIRIEVSGAPQGAVSHSRPRHDRLMRVPTLVQEDSFGRLQSAVVEEKFGSPNAPMLNGDLRHHRSEPSEVVESGSSKRRSIGCNLCGVSSDRSRLFVVGEGEVSLFSDPSDPGEDDKCAGILIRTKFHSRHLVCVQCLQSGIQSQFCACNWG